jgi:hypothetical protein
MSRTLLSAAIAAVLAAAVCGCADVSSRTPSPPAPAATTRAGETGATMSDSGARAIGRPMSPRQRLILTNGRSPAYIRHVDVRNRTVTFDVIEFLTGPEKTKRWSTDNLRRTGWPDNDYVIKNDSPKLRIMPVVTTARIRTIDSGRSVQATKPHTLSALAAYLDAQGSAALPYWLTAKNGRITAIGEIYLP